MALREVVALLSFQVDKASQKKAENAVSGLKRAATGLVGAFGLALGAREVVRGVASMISLASETTETANRLDQVFGPAAEGVTNQMADLATLTNRSRFELAEFASQAGVLTLNMTKTREEAGRMAGEIVSLAQDVSSFSDQSPERSFEAIRSALIGQSKPLQNLAGINVLAQDVAESIGMTVGQFGKLSSVQKKLARLNLIRGELSRLGILGDAARTATQGGNAFRGFQLAVQDLQRTLGKVLLPTAVEVILAFTKFIRQQERLAMQGKGLVPAFRVLAAVIGAFGRQVLRIAENWKVMLPLLAAGLAFLFPMVAAVVAVVVGLAMLGDEFEASESKSVGFFETLAQGFFDLEKETGSKLGAIGQMIKENVEGWGEIFGRVGAFIGQFFIDVGKGIVDAFVETFKFITDLLTETGIQDIPAVKGLLNLGEEAGKGLKQFDKFLNNDILRALNTPAGQLLGSQGAQATGPNMTLDQTNQVTVNASFPPGTSPEGAVDPIVSGVKSAMGDSNRQAIKSLTQGATP